jgi:hypothetical protein
MQILSVSSGAFLDDEVVALVDLALELASIVKDSIKCTGKTLAIICENMNRTQS